MAYYVYEAEYERDPTGPRSDWTKPIPETVKWSKAFENEFDANVYARGRAWASIDKSYHRVTVVTSLLFDPRNPATHNYVVNPDMYWDRR